MTRYRCNSCTSVFTQPYNSCPECGTNKPLMEQSIEGATFTREEYLRANRDGSSFEMFLFSLLVISSIFVVMAMMHAIFG